MKLVCGSEAHANRVDAAQIRRALEFVIRTLKIKLGGAILDLGAGFGKRAWVVLEFFSEYFSVDLCQNLVGYFNDEVLKTLSGKWPAATIHKMLVAPLSLVVAAGHQAVLLHHVLCHFSWYDSLHLLQKCKRFVVYKGIILVKEPRWESEETQDFRGSPVIIRRTRLQWVSLFHDAGLLVAHIEQDGGSRTFQ